MYSDYLYNNRIISIYIPQSTKLIVFIQYNIWIIRNLQIII